MKKITIGTEITCELQDNLSWSCSHPDVQSAWNSITSDELEQLGVGEGHPRQLVFNSMAERVVSVNPDAIVEDDESPEEWFLEGVDY